MKTNYSITKATVLGYDNGYGLLVDFLGESVAFEAKDIHMADMDLIKTGTVVLYNTLGLIETPEGHFRRLYCEVPSSTK